MFGSFVRYGYLLLGVFLPIQGGVANWIMWSSLVGTYLLSFIIFNKTDKLINTAVNESSVYDAMNMSMSAYGIGLVIGLVIAIIKYVVI